MTMKKLFTLCAILLLCSATVSLAGKTDTPVKQEITPPLSFPQLDGNGDGFINKEEAVLQAGLPDIFEKVDVNGDGKIDPKEFEAITFPQAEEALQTSLSH